MAVATDITLDNVRILRDIKESETEHTDPLVSPVIDAKNCTKTMESLEEYTRGNIGVKGVVLYYVERYKEAVAPSFDEPETSFFSAEDEMVAFISIIEGGLRTLTFKIDMMKVWGMISMITIELDFWNYVKSALRKRDGWKAYRENRGTGNSPPYNQ